MNHRNISATLGYYRIDEDRRREAVDRVAALQFDRHGKRIWRDVQALLDAERARYAIGEVAVPYGRCREPSNVATGGGACPIRFRPAALRWRCEIVGVSLLLCYVLIYASF